MKYVLVDKKIILILQLTLLVT